MILHEDITVVQRCRKEISEWLKDIGLELKPSKTRIAHTFDFHEQEKPGFNFLGFQVRQFPVGKYQTGKNTNGELLGFKTIITPSSDKVTTHQRKVAEVVEAHKAAPQAALISQLNPIIRGWANYYSTVNSKISYSKLDNALYHKLRAWAKHRHPNKGGFKVTDKYWRTVGGQNWAFATKGRESLTLLRHDSSKIRTGKGG